MEPEERLQLKFKVMDSTFLESLTVLKQEMNGRGLLLSGATIKKGHDLLIEELKKNSIAINEAFREKLIGEKSRSAAITFEGRAANILEERKPKLEAVYIQAMKVVLESLQNKNLINEYTSLDGVFELRKSELSVLVKTTVHEFEQSLGKTLLERVQNDFRNRPLIVIGVITIAAVSVILVFIGLLSDFFCNS